MIVDSSALLAVLYREPDAERYEELIATSGCRLSVANALEVAIVVEGRGGSEASQELDAFSCEHRYRTGAGHHGTPRCSKACVAPVRQGPPSGSVEFR